VARPTGGTLKLLLLIIIIIIIIIVPNYYYNYCYFRRLHRRIMRREFCPEAPDRPRMSDGLDTYVLRDSLRYSDTLQNIILHIYIYMCVCGY